jgi:hypothetical protein
MSAPATIRLALPLLSGLGIFLSLTGLLLRPART